MIIKVCGMRNGENIRAVEQIGVNWMGFIFYPDSSRYVSELPSYLPEKVKRVGVLVNESYDNILSKVREYELDIVQLHGAESPEFCRKLQSTGISVMKAFSIGVDKFPSALVSEYEGVCDYFLFDTKTISFGGSGIKFQWDLLKNYIGDTPFLLSGGISQYDVDAIKSFSHNRFIGVDINSRFESAPAFKDINSVKLFTDQLRGC